MKFGSFICVFFLALMVALTGPSKTMAQNVQKPVEILAHYCAWYQIPWSPKAYTTPVRGFYNSNNPVIAAAQNEEKNLYGIGVDMISWPGPIEAHQQENMLSGYFRAYNLYTRKFAILYEILPLLGEKNCYDFDDPLIAQKFIADIDYLVNTLFSWYSDYCYKIDGRPVLFIWTGKFKNFKRVSDSVKRKVYLVGPEFVLFPPDKDDKERIENLKCFDAITSYGIDPVFLAQKYGGLNLRAVQDYIKAVIKWDATLKSCAPQTDFILPIQFGYHDNRGDYDPQTGKTRILTSTKEQSEFFAQTVRFLINVTGRQKIFLVSYNEHYEGTGCETSLEQGDWWLSLIKKYFR